MILKSMSLKSQACVHNDFKITFAPLIFPVVVKCRSQSFVAKGRPWTETAPNVFIWRENAIGAVSTCDHITNVANPKNSFAKNRQPFSLTIFLVDAAVRKVVQTPGRQGRQPRRRRRVLALRPRRA